MTQTTELTPLEGVQAGLCQCGCGEPLAEGRRSTTLYKRGHAPAKPEQIGKPRIKDVSRVCPTQVRAWAPPALRNSILVLNPGVAAVYQRLMENWGEESAITYLCVIATPKTSWPAKTASGKELQLDHEYN